MIIDFRGRPPTPEYMTYFDASRVEWIAERVGAKGLSQAFLDVSLDGFFKEMEGAGIDYTVALGRNSPEMMVGERRFAAGIIPNSHVLDLQTRFPDKVIGFAGVDVTNKIHDALAEIDEFVAEKGLKGVFIEPQRSNGHPDDPSIFPIYERCIALDVPVSIMSGPFAGPDISFSDPARIDAVATRFPSLKIIVGHGCWPYVTEIIAVAFKHANVYVSPDIYHFTPGSEPYIEAANGFMADQLLFGTAYPIRRLKQTVEDFKSLPLKPESLEKALGENARRLLGIEEREDDR